MTDTDTVRADFDRLALLAGGDWDHSSHYHELLARHVPADCKEALEVGCGAGAFSRLLAETSERVLAIDLSPNMIRLAREESARFSNIDFRVADVLTLELPDNRFDCVATIATLHHMPAAQVLPKLKRALKPGGVLLILDLLQTEGVLGAAASALAVPVSMGLRLARCGRLRPPREVRRAWDEHGRQRHLLWRYSVVWKK
jgi:ubiquinone/menaquinone biosynthesis C-methylase UbiE